MRKYTSILLGFAAGALLAAGIGTAIARESSSPRLDSISLGAQEIHQLLPLMDLDHNGTVSKAEFTAYMDAQFARLEKNKSGDALMQAAAPDSHRAATFMTNGK